MDFLNRLFRLQEKNTTVSTEFRAGLSTFLAMMYIVPVNASIMSLTGMPFDALVTATAVVTIIATILNGFWSNTPVAMSVGMGLNAYFTFGLVKGMGIPWQTALGIVMISGIIFLILSFTKFRVWVLESVPDDLRRAISAGIGMFIAFIGLQGMGIIVKNDATLVSLGNIKDAHVLLGVFGFIMAALFYAYRIKGSFILSIVLTSIVAWVLGLANLPRGIISTPASIAPIAFKFDIMSALTLSLVPVIITFLITDMFDTIGTLAGIGMRAGLFQKGSKELQKTLEADAAATVIGASLGTSTTTSFIESAVGVEEGGRTGLTAIFTGLFFITTLFFLPLYKAIPSNAIYPILVMVGVLMFSELKNINFKDLTIAVSSFVTVILMPLTYSITIGLSAGFVTFLMLALLKREFDKINIGTITLALIGFLAFIFH
ncbi:NCS2 family permease [Caminibacter mediatlanticus TB-2]|uniref:NCS2 family permease n=1 Tax=Caminibacter mediatlanticus TB-2 TaxID=391592 RepID=A0ABX5V6L5_9BACT|nr:NCS2 family permease [Caminibacter mediatlanticus]QCT93910.1 NCS2 family permease [Caminibacter mediatlanticus TB-2]